MNIKENNPALYDDLMRRLKRIEGQARGIQRMLDEGQPCDQVLIQLGAMKAAINRVGMKAAACNMGFQITEAMKRGENPTEAVDDVIEQFIKLG